MADQSVVTDSLFLFSVHAFRILPSTAYMEYDKFWETDMVGIYDNWGIILHISPLKPWCGYSLEPPRQGILINTHNTCSNRELKTIILYHQIPTRSVSLNCRSVIFSRKDLGKATTQLSSTLNGRIMHTQ